MSTVDAETALHTTFIQRHPSTPGNWAWPKKLGALLGMSETLTQPAMSMERKESRFNSPTGLGASATFLTPHSPMLATDDAVSVPALTSVSRSPQPRLESADLQS
jgi:hypothetical protein